MNFQAAQEALFRDLGLQTSAERTAWQVQEVRDALNWSLDHIMTEALFWYKYARTATITVVAGTSEYELGDDVLLPISMWKLGDQADKVWFIDPTQVDRIGLRSTTNYPAQGEAYQYTSMQGRMTPTATNVCNVSGTGLTFVSGTAFADAHVGARVRINGEAPEYYIASHSTPNVVLDRAYLARASGEAAYAASTTATSATIEISPAPVRKIEIVPVSNEAQTLYHRYARRWSYQLNDTDVPDGLDEHFHWLWVDGGRMRIKKFKEDADAYRIYKHEFDQGVKKLRSQNTTQFEESAGRYEALFSQDKWPGGGSRIDQTIYRRRSR